MRVIIREPFKPMRYEEVPNELKPLQDLIGGYIEIYPITSEVLMIVDEEGLLKNTRFNFRLDGQFIMGTAIFVGVDGEEFADCPIQIEELREILRTRADG